MQRRILGCLAFLLATTISAQGTYQLEDFQSSQTHIGGSILTVDGNTYAQTAWSPNIDYKGLEIGFDLNLYIPFDEDAPYPTELDTLNLRYLGYNYKDKHGFRWGRISGLTLGQGLLMDNYDSGTGQSVNFNTQKAGFLGYTTIGGYRADVLYTATSVNGGRISGPVPKLSLLGAPVHAGVTYVQDSDGYNYLQENNLISRPKKEGAAADIFWPVGGDFLTVYGEYAQLTDRLEENAANSLDGNGLSVGVRGDFLGMLAYQAGFIQIGEDFVPGYFNSIYETTSTPQGADESESGIVGSISTDFMSAGMYRAGVKYQRLGDRNLATASVGWRDIGPTTGVINYEVPFQGNSNRVAQADIAYDDGGRMSYVVHIKRVYVSNSEYVETYAVSTRFNIPTFF